MASKAKSTQGGSISETYKTTQDGNTSETYQKTNRAAISIVCVFSPATGLFELLVALGLDQELVSQGQGFIEILPF